MLQSFDLIFARFSIVVAIDLSFATTIVDFLL